MVPLPDSGMRHKWNVSLQKDPGCVSSGRWASSTHGACGLLGIKAAGLTGADVFFYASDTRALGPLR